jgi:hypothetical protein
VRTDIALRMISRLGEAATGPWVTGRQLLGALFWAHLGPSFCYSQRDEKGARATEYVRDCSVLETMDKRQLGKATDGLYATVIRDYVPTKAERFLKDMVALCVAAAAALGRSLKHADYDVWLTAQAAAAQLEEVLADVKRGEELWTNQVQSTSTRTN